ncbi:MAG: cell division protein FtsX, partial [Bacteroidales bacterium]
VAALVAICMLFGLIYYLTLQIDNFASIITTEDLIVVVCIVLILGIIISAISAHFAVNKYLRMKTDKLYYV